MGSSKVRPPAVAGQFYQADSRALRAQIGLMAGKPVKKHRSIACLLPHAGYIYSGNVAAETVARIELPDKIILLGPNHTGQGKEFSLMEEGLWQTPLGQLEVDADLALKLLKGSKYLTRDTLAHLSEHSLEVELPILQYFKSDFKIVPIVIMTNDVQALSLTGDEIASVINKCGMAGQVLIVASSDMTHYESEPVARKKDQEAIKAMLALDESALIKKVRDLDISMCGVAPAIVMLRAAKALGANKAELVKYQTSGEATGDNSSVVGYAGIRFF